MCDAAPPSAQAGALAAVGAAGRGAGGAPLHEAARFNLTVILNARRPARTQAVQVLVQNFTDNRDMQLQHAVTSTLEQ